MSDITDRGLTTGATATSRDADGSRPMPAEAGPDARRDDAARRPGAAAPSVRPGQVWNDNRVQGEGGPFRVICVDSAFAYGRGSPAGDGAVRRVSLSSFDGRARGGLVLVSDADSTTDLIERRVLTALWQLDYSGMPRRLDSIADLLGGFYSMDDIRAALASAEADGLVVAAADAEGEWSLTGGGRRLAAVG
ncbi:MAG: hypothetical protein M3N16_02405 [Actinomycetota bacterium]|nr:hypothetical protein [Actinomycetota bacterium]